jgi:hypothetical protein
VSYLAQEIVETKDLAATVSDWLQAVAFGAGVLGIVRYFRDKRIERQSGARALYTDFMNASVAHPELYGGAWTDGSLRTTALQQKYIYYVGSFLWAAEELLREFRCDKKWRETILVTVREHRDYLNSEQFKTEKAGYSDELIRLIREGSQDA